MNNEANYYFGSEGLEADLYPALLKSLEGGKSPERDLEEISYRLLTKLKESILSSESSEQRLKALLDALPPVPGYDGPAIQVGFDSEYVLIPHGKNGWKAVVLTNTLNIACGDYFLRFPFDHPGQIVIAGRSSATKLRASNTRRKRSTSRD